MEKGNEIENMIRTMLGDEKFFEFQKTFGGIKIYVRKSGADAIWYYYKEKNLTPLQVSVKLNVSESFVYSVIRKKLNQKEKDNAGQQELF